MSGDLRIVKGPLKGTIVRLVGKYDNTHILVQNYNNGQVFTILTSYTKEITHDKKLVELKKISSIKKTESVNFISEAKEINSEHYQSFDYPDNPESDEFLEPDLYKVGYENMQHNLIDKKVLNPLDNKIYSFIKSIFDVLYTKSMNIDDIIFLAKKIAKIVEKNNIPPAKYKFFISLIIFTLIKKQDLQIPDTFVMKFTQESYFDFLKNQSELKPSLKDIPGFTKVIIHNFYRGEPEKKVVSKRNGPSLKEIIKNVTNDAGLSKKQKEILLKSIPLFPDKDFSNNLNPLVKSLYLEYLGK